MRDRVVYCDSRNPRFMKTSHQTILLCLCFVTCGSQICKDIQKQIKDFSVCLSYLLGYQCANKPNSNVSILNGSFVS